MPSANFLNSGNSVREYEIASSYSDIYNLWVEYGFPVTQNAYKYNICASVVNNWVGKFRVLASIFYLHDTIYSIGGEGRVVEIDNYYLIIKFVRK